MTKQDVVDSVVRNLLATVGPRTLAVALNNASVHGEAIEEYGFAELGDGDAWLGEWYNGIELMVAAAKKMGG